MTRRYERVSYRPPGRLWWRTVRLEVTGDSGRFLTGFEVDAAGERIPPSAAYLAARGTTVGVVVHTIPVDLVWLRVPLALDPVTGRLVKRR